MKAFWQYLKLLQISQGKTHSEVGIETLGLMFVRMLLFSYHPTIRLTLEYSNFANFVTTKEKKRERMRKWRAAKEEKRIAAPNASIKPTQGQCLQRRFGVPNRFVIKFNSLYIQPLVRLMLIL